MVWRRVFVAIFWTLVLMYPYVLTWECVVSHREYLLRYRSGR